MLHRYLDLVPESVGDTLSLITRIAERRVPDDESISLFADSFEEVVWERMKVCDELPDIGEIYTGVVIDYAKMVISAVMPDADFEVEGTHDISITINGDSISNYRSFNRAYEEHIAEDIDDDEDCDEL